MLKMRHDHQRIAPLHSKSGKAGERYPDTGRTSEDCNTGDPDQPLITARPRQKSHCPAVQLPHSRTRVSIRKKTVCSEEHSEGFNELRFEHRAGSEQICLHTQRNQGTGVLNGRTTTASHDYAEKTGNSQTITVNGCQLFSVQHYRKVSTTENQSRKIGSNHSANISGSQCISVTKTQQLTLTPQNTFRQGKILPDELASGQSDNQAENKKEYTLIIGVFFDGTGNNEFNSKFIQENCSKADLTTPESKQVLNQCIKDQKRISDTAAISYTSGFTNIHWLKELYKEQVSEEKQLVQQKIYIEGAGTEKENADSKTGMGLGVGSTGVKARANSVSEQLAEKIKNATEKMPDNAVIKALKFDIFGFSRGAATARHFANMIYAGEKNITELISRSMENKQYHGAPAGKIRFIGIFETVASIPGPENFINAFFDRMDNDKVGSGDLKLALPPDIAESVFHLTARHECRHYYPLTRAGTWPELELPGVHADLGGGYLPVESENLYLTRPRRVSIHQHESHENTSGYKQSLNEYEKLITSPPLAVLPVIKTSKIEWKSWTVDLPLRLKNKNSGPEKYGFSAAVLLDRVVKNDWSKVTLRVMLDAAQEAGLMFSNIEEEHKLRLPEDLLIFCEKAIAAGRAVRKGQTPVSFTPEEIQQIAEKYIHCSANWGSPDFNSKGGIYREPPLTNFGFPSQPNKNWLRTVYDMNGVNYEN